MGAFHCMFSPLKKKHCKVIFTFWVNAVRVASLAGHIISITQRKVNVSSMHKKKRGKTNERPFHEI